MVLYNLVYDGKVQDGVGVRRVKKNLTSLFKTDSDKVDRLFSGTPTVIKKGVDYDTAMKYQHALRRAGAICAVEQVVNPAEAPPVPLHAAAGRAEVNSTPVSKPDETEGEAEKHAIRGFGDIVAGGFLIGIGLVMGGSVFLGNPGWLDYIFDSLGVFWIGYGIFKMIRSRGEREE
jgi:hypothetical protein